MALGAAPGVLPVSAGALGGALVGLGGRGALPSMMSLIWSASMVSHSISAAVIASTLSRLSLRIFLANAY